MSNANSIENVILKNPEFAKHPELEDLLNDYSAAINAGYVPDVGTSVAILDALSNVSTADPALQAAIDQAFDSVSSKIAEKIDTVSVGAAGGARMISVAQDGTLAQFDFLANNGGFAYGTAMGDINGDGNSDVLISGDWSGAVIYYGDGAGGFTSAGVSILGQFQSAVEIADIDNDGDGDFYVQNGLGDSEVWRNDDGTFTQVFSYTNYSSNPPYRTMGDALFEDVNGDGAVDMLINQTDEPTIAIADKLFLNDGSGNFTASSAVLPTATGFANMALADVDNDGDVDYIRGTSNGVAVATNDGAGNFTSPVSDLGAVYNGTIAVADFNGDGYLDVARDNRDTKTGIEIWLGDGSDEFVFDHTILSTVGATATNLIAGDFSGDGLADLIYTDYTSNELVSLLNDGDGNFVETDALALPGSIFGTDADLL